MKDTKKRMEIFSTYDYCGIARHLKKMAKRGWMLAEIGNYTWTYKRCDPCDARFAVTYFPEASAFDPEPGEDQQTYIEYCEEAGWELCACSAKMQVQKVRSILVGKESFRFLLPIIQRILLR